MFETEHEGEEPHNHKHKADESVMCKQGADQRVPFAEDGDFVGDEIAERVVVDCEENIPVDELGQGDVLLLFLVSLD